MGKVLCLALLSCSLFASAQEVKKPNGETVIVLDKKQSEICEKHGCVIIPVHILEQLIKETAKYLCNQRT